MHGASIATMSNWIFNFVVVQITPPCVKNIGYRTYVMFAIFNASFVVLTYFFYPETKGLQLEAVNELFEENQRWFIGTVDVKPYANASRKTEMVAEIASSPMDEKSDLDVKQVITA